MEEVERGGAGRWCTVLLLCRNMLSKFLRQFGRPRVVGLMGQTSGATVCTISPG